MKVSQIFNIFVAKSKSTEDYSDGSVPFVTNTQINNGVVKYVEPFDDDKVFPGPAICISGLGHATVHLSDFLPKGNGGDSCTILVPLMKLTNLHLVYYASLFNVLHSWRFSFGRKASKRRIQDLKLIPLHSQINIDLEEEVKENNQLMSTLLNKKEHQFLSQGPK